MKFPIAFSAALALGYGYCVRVYSLSIAAGLWIYLPLLAVSGLSLSSLRRAGKPERIGPDGRSRLADIALEALDWKNPELLKRYVTEAGKILPRRLTGTSLKFQRKVGQAIKRSRHLALMPYVADMLK